MAGLLLVLGLMWLLVPPSTYRKVAIYDFWRTIVIPLLFFGLMLRWVRTERDIWRMVGAWMIAAALVGREGVEQFLFGEATTMEGVQRATSVYPSATAFGIYLGRGLALGIVLAIFLPREWRLWKWGLGALSFVIGLGTLVSFARGAWIGVLVSLVVVAVITRHKRLLQGIGVTVLLGLAAVPFIRAERIISMFNFTARENTGLARVEIWTSALRILRDRPIQGIGQDQFLYQDPSYGVPQGRFLTTSHPHNFILDFWLRLGLPGLLWIIAALAFFFWQSIQLWRRYAGTALGALTLGLIASMVDFAVHGLLDMAYFTMDLALTFWMTVALVVIMRRLPDVKRET
jgi:O-antigen ligase